MRAVVDTNMFISAVLSPIGLPARLLDRALHRLDDEALDQRVERFRQESTMVVPTERLSVVTHDESDNRFIECAVAGRAEVVVSGDRHLLTVDQYQGIRVLTPAAFVAYLDALHADGTPAA